MRVWPSSPVQRALDAETTEAVWIQSSGCLFMEEAKRHPQASGPQGLVAETNEAVIPDGRFSLLGEQPVCRKLVQFVEWGSGGFYG